MSVVYEFVNLKDVISEIAMACSDHINDVNSPDDYGAINIDWDAYINAMNLGMMYAVTVRKDRKLVGYAVYQIGTNNRHKHIIEATSCGVYMERSFRGKASFNMLKFADKKLMESGVHRIDYILKSDGEGMSRILESNGYEPKYKVWSLNNVKN